jgi:two-component system OmpR family sensor kinase
MHHANATAKIGLSIVDAVMRAHGGDVTVESELGKGAAFTLRFNN